MHRSIFIGYDPRERDAYDVAWHSLLRRMSAPIPVHKLSLGDLQGRGLYTRPTWTVKDKQGTRLRDILSMRDDYDGSISTEHAIARFFVPMLAKEGWALFCDGDVLFRADVCEVFEGLDESKAVYCVQHIHVPEPGQKMDGQLQTRYLRKNWSSVCLFNADHPSNAKLIPLLNTAPGRDLHAFCWLDDSEIGRLGTEWNHLVGWSDTQTSPKIVHFTSGIPNMLGYENVDYADEWRAELARLRPVPVAAE